MSLIFYVTIAGRKIHFVMGIIALHEFIQKLYILPESFYQGSMTLILLVRIRETGYRSSARLRFFVFLAT